MSDSDPGLVTFWVPPTEVPQEEGALEGLVPEIRGTAGRWHFLSAHNTAARMGPTTPGAETVDCLLQQHNRACPDGGCAQRVRIQSCREESGAGAAIGPGGRRLSHRRADVQRMHAGQHSLQLTGSALNHHPGWP